MHVRATSIWRGVNWQQAALLLIAVSAAFSVRLSLRTVFTSDYTEYMEGWIATLRAGGFSALGQEFANYNVPYLYLLLIGGTLPLEGLSVVKLISCAFDLVLAAGVGAIVHRLGRSSMTAATAAVSALFIPEVFLNSGMWGQADSIYTSFLVWSAYFVLSRRDVAAWIMFALALEFKLQAVFLLPWMALAFIIQRHRWRSLAYAAAVVVAFMVPAMVAGRSLRSILRIYVDQTGTGILAMHVANMYQWVSQSLASVVGPAGIALAIGMTALLCVAYLRASARSLTSDIGLIQVAAAFSAVIPFVLPEMHDRYFYPAGVLALVCAFIDRRYLVPAALFQFTAVMTYSMALLGQEPVFTFKYLAIIQLVAVLGVVLLSFCPSRQKPAVRVVAAEHQQDPVLCQIPAGGDFIDPDATPEGSAIPGSGVAMPAGAGVGRTVGGTTEIPRA
jgi:Gpi18-like mannosyltransferase